MTNLLHTDLELFMGWRRGDVAMGGALFERHKTAVTNLFRRNVRNKAEIPDLVQQTFLACLNSKNPPQITGTVRGYILGIAFHTMTRFFRKRVHEPQSEFDELGGNTMAAVEPDPEYLLTLNDEQRLLMKAIRRLKIEHQVIIELNYWEGISCDDIATILEVPQGTIRRRLQEGRAVLERLLKELADSPELLAATTMSLGTWQHGIRNWIAARAAQPTKPRH